MRAFKAYMCASSPGYPRLDDAALLEALERLAELDALLIVHAENDSLLQAGLARMAAAGRTDPLAHAESRPPLVEIEAIARVVRFATHTGTRLHVAHVSTPGGAEIVRAAKAAGARVTCETCPQYLLMDHDDLVRLGAWARCAPAIRARARRRAAVGVRPGRDDRLARLRPLALHARGEAGRRGRHLQGAAWASTSSRRCCPPCATRR